MNGSLRKAYVLQLGNDLTKSLLDLRSKSLVLLQGAQICQSVLVRGKNTRANNDEERKR